MHAQMNFDATHTQRKSLDSTHIERAAQYTHLLHTRRDTLQTRLRGRTDNTHTQLSRTAPCTRGALSWQEPHTRCPPPHVLPPAVPE